MMKHKLRRMALATAAMAAVVAAAAPANAVTINLKDIGGVTGSAAEQGFRIAAKYWESVLTNNATININVGYSALGAGILGGTSSNVREYVPIGTYYNGLKATGNSALDTLVKNNLAPLSATGSVAVTVPDYFNTTTKTGIADTGTRLAPDGKPISNTIGLLTANNKAIFGGGETTTDATIQFSSTFKFDFDPTNGISTGTYDFIGVAIHEIGHALGFVSGADDFDYSTGAGANPDTAWWGYGLDMFRYSAAGKLDWSFDTDSYFSVDGGKTAFMDGYFSTGENNGDGWQASHWKEPASQGCTGLRGIMNPYICSASVDSVTALDLAAFDAIGWNLNVDVLKNPGYRFSTADAYRAFAASVPEPTTWVQMLLGFALLGGALRYRRRDTKVSFAA